MDDLGVPPFMEPPFFSIEIGNFIIPTDENSYFLEGWLNHQPDTDVADIRIRPTFPQRFSRVGENLEVS